MYHKEIYFHNDMNSTENNIFFIFLLSLVDSFQRNKKSYAECKFQQREERVYSFSNITQMYFEILLLTCEEIVKE